VITYVYACEDTRIGPAARSYRRKLFVFAIANASVICHPSTVNCLLWSVVCLTNLWRESCHKFCACSFKHQPLTSDREKFFTVSFHWNLL